jgi:hypothetical protein
MFRHRSATPAGVTGNGEVRSPGDNVTSIQKDRPWTREPTRRLPASRRSGASRPGPVNPGEVLIKAVNRGQPKMLSGWDQKVRGQVQGLQAPRARMAHHRPRGTTSPRSDRAGERSNPVAPPAREGGLQRTLMRQRRRDEGGSECRAVMDRIEGGSSAKMGRPRRSCRPTCRWRTTSPHRESGLTSLGSSVTRDPRPTDSGRQAEMSAAEMLAGAAPGRAPDRHSLEGKKVGRTVRRLQARIVKAAAKAAASREGRL